MKTKLYFTIRNLFLVIVMITSCNPLIAQNNPFQHLAATNSKDVVMTWNKDTPEQEMKDDIKALSEKGITIKYQDIKRNAKNEITAIKVSYEDRKGNEGNLSYSNINPINNIVFSKNEDSVGFGETSTSSIGFASNFGNIDEILKQFQMQSNQNNSKSQTFQFPGEGQKSGMSIRKEFRTEGKKPVVIENGKIIEGGDDYTKEQLDQMLKNDKESKFVFGKSFDMDKEFDFRNENDLNAFKDKFGSKFFEEKDSMKTATEEIQKAKEELQKAKK